MSTITRPRAASADTRQIRAMIRDWTRALEARDIDALMASYAPDVVVYDLKPPYRLQGISACRAMWEECLPCFPAGFRSEHRDLEITVGGDVAFVHGLHRFIIDSDPDHPAGKSWVRITVGYQRMDGRWRVVHEHVSIPFSPMNGAVAPITDKHLAA